MPTPVVSCAFVLLKNIFGEQLILFSSNRYSPRLPWRDVHWRQRRVDTGYLNLTSESKNDCTERLSITLSASRKCERC